MQYGYSDACQAHTPGPRHPETPDRLRAIRQRFSKVHGVRYVDAQPAPESALRRVHTPGYIDRLREFCADGGGQWDVDTVAVPETYTAARHSAGLAQWAARTAREHPPQSQTPFALGRPPGHHAVADDAMGFCFVNNIAVAAATLIESGVDRVAILDIDVHHGNGTQQVFYDHPDVLFVSLHESDIYPGTGDHTETGTDDGAGTTVNVPLPPGTGDAGYLHAVEQLVRPVIDRFGPDVLLVSAGFDAHADDPISRQTMTTEGYGAVTAAINAVGEAVDAGVGFILEGGYNLRVLADSVEMIHKVHHSYEPAHPTNPPGTAVCSVVDAVADVHDVD